VMRVGVRSRRRQNLKVKSTVQLYSNFGITGG
jgi:hypothetical protein